MGSLRYFLSICDKSLAAYGGGLIYKLFNSYTWAYFLAGIFCALASLFVIVMKKQTLNVGTQKEINMD